jgi:hypothetical protein
LHRLLIGEQIVAGESRENQGQEPLWLWLIVLIEKELSPIALLVIIALASLAALAAVSRALAIFFLAESLLFFLTSSLFLSISFLVFLFYKVG